MLEPFIVYGDNWCSMIALDVKLFFFYLIWNLLWVTCFPNLTLSWCRICPKPGSGRENQISCCALSFVSAFISSEKKQLEWQRPGFLSLVCGVSAHGCFITLIRVGWYQSALQKQPGMIPACLNEAFIDGLSMPFLFFPPSRSPKRRYHHSYDLQPSRGPRCSISIRVMYRAPSFSSRHAGSVTTTTGAARGFQAAR